MFDAQGLNQNATDCHRKRPRYRSEVHVRWSSNRGWITRNPEVIPGQKAACRVGSETRLGAAVLKLRDSEIETLLT
jgi:hypothetical protein